MTSVERQEYACPDCDNQDVEFTGDHNSAHGVCPDCGPVEICPAEIWAARAEDAADDARRDGH